jgi:CspA family cold shock protein
MREYQIYSCRSCGTRFVWTSSEQAANSTPPGLCPACRLLAPPAGRVRGVVKFYNARKGWGFIVPTTGKEIYVHRRGLSGEGPLREGDLVEFAVEDTPRGPQAVEVQWLETEAEG